jgi:hypothetical protein
MADNLPVVEWQAIIPTDDIRAWRVGRETFIAPDVGAALSVARARYGIDADVLKVEDVATFRGF